MARRALGAARRKRRDRRAAEPLAVVTAGRAGRSARSTARRRCRRGNPADEAPRPRGRRSRRPGKRQDLPGARREALRVAEILEERGRRGHSADRCAGRFRAKGRWPKSRRPIASRCSGCCSKAGSTSSTTRVTGTSTREDPTRAGWVFARGLLTGAEIGRIEQVPAIVVANACLSARTSGALAGGRAVGDDASEAALLPSLADEFFQPRRPRLRRNGLGGERRRARSCSRRTSTRRCCRSARARASRSARR